MSIQLEVHPPAVGGFCKSEREVRPGEPIRLSGSASELYAGLRGRASAFALVAGLAGGHDVFPAFAPALDDRHDVVERELSLAELSVAVLADIVVAQKDVRARKSDNVLFAGERDVTEQSKYRRYFDRQANCSDLLI